MKVNVQRRRSLVPQGDMQWLGILHYGKGASRQYTCDSQPPMVLELMEHLGLQVPCWRELQNGQHMRGSVEEFLAARY